MPPSQPNQFLLAADNSPTLLPLLRSDPTLASSQDEHGYSLLHAAASYNHIDLLRTLVNEFHVDVNLKDEDGETALFVVETVECAKTLVEELHASISLRGDDGTTALEKITEEGDFPEVAVYLRIKQLENGVAQAHDASVASESTSNQPLAIPEGVQINIGTLAPDEIGDEVVDQEFKRRIEELAAREDFQGEVGQAQLRELITEAIRGDIGHERDVRRRTS
ncbi:Ankyrin repeat-containing protein [Glarea lozoyensis ATCC 20868]|uniref:Ankyrin repeat-containing protein n=1 Tax=Glarea lozoyensis (strain ATCC 20868 / MF5171) TaxID=1116229 RepID=S3CHB1_GLAL2|nr:Ankyrin repeat-containing protein [Glarea lozoyensis ATCC 20868]EPE25250.1 Ankyrin repeat-containing protein [Glarea lozoyensis ATCC 20868]